MERLTYKEGNHYYSKDDCIVDVRTINEDSLNVMQNWLDQLGAYEDAEEQGLLLRLPAPLDGVERFSLDNGKTTWQRVYEPDMTEEGTAMNENEAIEVLKDFDKQVTAKADGAYQSTIGKMACDTAIRALEEVQQYRTYKKKFQKIYGDCENALEVLLSLLLEYEIKEAKGSYIIRLLTDDDAKKRDEYRALGTPEELRVLKDKQVAKTVSLRRHVRKLDGFDEGDCPTCGEFVSRECDGDDIFCPSCGQKLDWSDEE